MRAHSVSNCRWRLAAMLRGPSEVSKVPEGAAVAFWVPMGSGGTPLTR